MRFQVITPITQFLQFPLFYLSNGAIGKGICPLVYCVGHVLDSTVEQPLVRLDLLEAGNHFFTPSLQVLSRKVSLDIRQASSRN